MNMKKLYIAILMVSIFTLVACIDHQEESLVNHQEESFANHQEESFVNHQEETFVNHQEESFANRQEETFVNRQEALFLGKWEAGYGDRMTIFERTHHAEFLPDGTLTLIRHGRESEGLSLWELDDQGNLVMENTRGNQIVFAVEVSGGVLTLRDEDGYERIWRREGVEESRNIEDSEDLLGIWEYGFGDRISGFGSGIERHVEFLSDGIFVFGSESLDRTWELNEDSQIVVESTGYGTIDFDFEVDDDRLIIMDELGNRRTWHRAGTREKNSDLPFLGAWEYGLGDVLTCFRHSHIIEFSPDRTLAYERGDTHPTSNISWELDYNGVLLMECSGSVVQFDMEIDENILMISDAFDNLRTWRRVGTDESRYTPNPEVFLGSWEYGHGHRLPILENPESIEFLPNGSVYGVANHIMPWQLNDAGSLVMGEQAVELTIEVEDDVLTIMDVLGNTRTWLREGTGTSEGRHWLVEDYLDYFTVAEDYQIVDSISFIGNQLDFVVYRLALIGEDRASDYVIIVKQQEEVIDVLHHYSWNAGIHFVYEVDLNGDGQKDVLLLRGRDGNSAFRTYSAFLQSDNGLVEVSDFRLIRNPRICPTSRHLLASWRDTCCIHGWEVYTFDGNEVVKTKQLVRNAHNHGRVLWTERLLIDGQWQEHEVCMITDDEINDELSDELCPNDYDPILYERIFGEDAYWNHRWAHLAESDWD